jgi:acyl carrier protein
MDRLEIEDKAKKSIVEVLRVDVDSIADDSRLGIDLNADSLDLIELIMQIEDDFDIEIPDEEAESILTFKSLVDVVEKKLENESS